MIALPFKMCYNSYNELTVFTTPRTTFEGRMKTLFTQGNTTMSTFIFTENPKQYARDNYTKRPIRDSQRQKLYDAETDAFYYHKYGVPTYKLPQKLHCYPDKETRTRLQKGYPVWTHTDQVQAFVDAVMNRSYIKKHFPGVRYIRVTDGRSRRRAGALFYPRPSFDHEIRMPRWSREPMVTLHEMAHILTDHTYGFMSVPAHGREFAAIFLELVRHVMGKECADALKKGYKGKNVKYKMKRVISPELREKYRAMGHRLAASRKAK